MFLSLINSVRKYPALYDQNDPDYRNTKRKAKIWQKIAKSEDHYSGDDVKWRWLRLREHHHSAVRSLEDKTKQLASDFPSTYQSEMEFLLPFMRQRSAASLTSDYYEEEFIIDEPLALERVRPYREDDPVNSRLVRKSVREAVINQSFRGLKCVEPQNQEVVQQQIALNRKLQKRLRRQQALNLQNQTGSQQNDASNPDGPESKQQDNLNRQLRKRLRREYRWHLQQQNRLQQDIAKLKQDIERVWQIKHKQTRALERLMIVFDNSSRLFRG